MPSVSALVLLSTMCAIATCLDFRLFGGPSRREGLLQVLPPGESQWGTVCAKAGAFHAAEAAAACASVGFQNDTSEAKAYTTTANHATIVFGAGQPIYLSSIKCEHHDVHTRRSLSQCFFHLTLDGAPDSCTHNDDVYLICPDAAANAANDRISEAMPRLEKRFFDLLSTANAESERTSLVVVARHHDFRFSMNSLLLYAYGIPAHRMVYTPLLEASDFSEQVTILNLTISDELIGNFSGSLFGIHFFPHKARTGFPVTADSVILFLST